MNQLTRPASIPVIAARPDDPRLGHLIRSADVDALPAGTRLAIVGFPSDQGIGTNGGRLGAAEGPSAIRKALYKLTPDSRPEFASLAGHMVDLGDVVCTNELAEDQRRLGQVVAAILRAGAIPIVLGGGHETSFGHFLGYVNCGRGVSIMNFDAHADVRPLVDGRGHSGSPFRQIIEHSSGLCSGYAVYGLNRSSTATAHLDYLREHEGQFVFRDPSANAEPRGVEHLLSWLIARENCTGVMASFDIDAVGQANAPGVSAPNACGFSADQWLAAAYQIGQCPKVVSMDIAELSPPLDIDGRTARLAAATAWWFIMGVSRRV